MSNKRPVNICRGLIPVLALALSSMMPFACAETNDKYSLTIGISGTIVSNGSCTFNAGQNLQVDFGEVKLQGTGKSTVALLDSYVRPLASTFTCTGDSFGLLQMQFASVSGSYEVYNGTKVLGTDKGIVAVELLANGEPKNMGQWFTVDPSAPPVLQAQLVQVSNDNSSKVVSGETFTASGTLTLAFN